MSLNNNNFIVLLIALYSVILYSCDQSKFGHGKRLYTTHCQSCHMETGEGLASLIPSLDSDYYRANRENLACIIRYGLEEKITVNGKLYDQIMLGNKYLSTTDITNIINYIDNELLREQRFTASSEIEEYLTQCK